MHGYHEVHHLPIHRKELIEPNWRRIQDWSDSFSENTHKQRGKAMQKIHGLTYLASRNLDLKIITASHVLCLSCIWMELNFRWMMPTILSISFGEMGRVLLCSRRRFITCVVNSLHACNRKKTLLRTLTLCIIIPRHPPIWISTLLAIASSIRQWVGKVWTKQLGK